MAFFFSFSWFHSERVVGSHVAQAHMSMSSVMFLQPHMAATCWKLQARGRLLGAQLNMAARIHGFLNMAMKHGLCAVPVDWVMVDVLHRPAWLCFALKIKSAERVG
jgi:hypothetical protein